MTYLVDYENVPNTGIDGIENLTSSDNVIIFLNENNTFKAKTHIKLENAVAKKDYIFVTSKSANALDFQLVAYLGMLCAEKPQERYVIVSNDQGYDSAIKFLKGRNFKVERKTNLAMTSTLSEVKKLLPELKDEDCIKVTNVVENYKTKQAINNNLMKIFGSDKTGNIYKKIKPLLRDKN